jgi:hypothetical protein
MRTAAGGQLHANFTVFYFFSVLPFVSRYRSSRKSDPRRADAMNVTTCSRPFEVALCVSLFHDLCFFHGNVRGYAPTP